MVTIMSSPQGWKFSAEHDQLFFLRPCNGALLLKLQMKLISESKILLQCFVFHSWVTQAGYPVVTVTGTSEEDEVTTLSLTQKRLVTKQYLCP